MKTSKSTSSVVVRILTALVAVVCAVIAGDTILATTAPVPDRSQAMPAAYGCNTGTTKGMTFTYDDIHRWNAQIISVSNLTGVPANVIKGIMWVESRGMLNARSPLTSSGYYFGLMQIGATSAVPEYMKSVTWMCDNPYNQILAGATELINKSTVIKSTDWTQVAGAYFGYGTDVNGTTTNAYMQMFFNHATAMSGTTPGAADWSPPAPPTPTPIPYLNYASGTTITIDTAKLNMRTGASTSASIIRVLTKGTTVTVISGPKKSGNSYWYQIRLADGTTGWISGNYTKGPTPTATPIGTATPTGTPTATPTLGTITPSATATPSPTTASNTGAAYKVTTKLNLRETPSTSGKILTTLASGTVVTLLGESRQADGHLWQKVQTGSRIGWVSMKYLSEIRTPTPTATKAPSLTPAAGSTTGPGSTFSIGDTVQVRSGPLNVRSGAGTSSSIYGTVKTGTRGVVLAGPVVTGGDGWYQLRIAGMPDGWVAGRYLVFVSAQSTATATTVPTETPTATLESTMTPTPTEIPFVADVPTDIPPTEIVPTETPTIEPAPTEVLPPDSDGVEDALDVCPGVPDTGLDSDGDGIDDGCDESPFGNDAEPAESSPESEG